MRRFPVWYAAYQLQKHPDQCLPNQLEKQRDLEAKLASERQGRLNISDKLDAQTKTSRQHEKEATDLRGRLREVEPELDETRKTRLQLEKTGDAKQREQHDLLLKVFKDVNRFLGQEVRDQTVVHERHSSSRNKLRPPPSTYCVTLWCNVSEPWHRYVWTSRSASKRPRRIWSPACLV